ncbi:MAG: patatin family protein, partial [Nitrospiraceae bacterium]
MSISSEKAVSIISGLIPVPEFKDLKSLVSALKADLQFRLAGKLLELSRPLYPEKVWIVQQLALCTYKDEEVLPATRFQKALEFLEEIGLRKEETDDPETLALGGAVYKRMWEYRGQIEHLHESLAFYRAGWHASLKPEPGSDKAPSPPRDYGYSAVNAAYILDVLASRARVLSKRTGTRSEEAEKYAREAKELREDALERLKKAYADDLSLEKYDWFAVTLAELHFGLEHYDDAGEWLKMTMERGPSEWELQTSFRQFVNIARLQQIHPPREHSELKDWHPAWRALSRFLGEKETLSALSCYRGKVGLALSGGGFRASLFHLGVLARLAEMDALRSIEALSTVSGGSIVGALYYLEVQHLLQTKEDHFITREDYIEIIRRIQERFLSGVQKNLRTQVLSDFVTNIKMIYTKEYSRSHRLGELYEKELYSRIGEDDTLCTEPRLMRNLLITPAGHSVDKPFKPKFSNWRRRARIPVLLLNTTSLNSGHSWHFTARWMGEPPGSVSTEVDVNDRYRRLWYEQAPEERHRNYRLGYAVAASACVPGLFEPLPLEGLYPGRTVRLVDGGVHDNQGVEGLLDEGCTIILCSDASGQMEDLKRPSDSVIGVPLRSNSILMDRVREAEYHDLRGRVESRSLQGLFFIHLKKDLKTLPVDWINCDNPTVPPHQSTCTTDYGVDRDLQRRLAAIRTDLDSFSEIEAYSLMLSGYLMAEQEFRELDKQHRKDGEIGTWGDFDVDAPRGAWTFLQLENLMRQPPDTSDARRRELEKHLEAGSSLFFKIWKLNPTLHKLGLTVGAALAILLLWFAYSYRDTQITLIS